MQQYNLTVEQIMGLLRQVVMDMGYHKREQINTFYAVDNDPNLSHPSIGASSSDYLTGRYWSRAWVLGGASPQLMAAEYPALIAEQRNVRILEWMEEFVRVEVPVHLLVIQRLGCDGCEVSINGYQAAGDTQLMMMRVLRELRTYGVYEVDDGQEVREEWMSAGRAEYLETVKGWTVDGPLAQLPEFLPEEEPEEVVAEWGNLPNFRGAWITLRFQLCLPTAGSWNYKDLPVRATAQHGCC